MFLGHPDPDPFVRGMNPDPDPSIIMQKQFLGSRINHDAVKLFNKLNCKKEKETLNIPNTIVCDPPTASNIQFFQIPEVQ